jgi:hypothetical protein
MSCCREYRCRRAKPILIRQGWLSGRWFAITDYKSVEPMGRAPDAPPLIEALQKHDVHDEMVAALIDAGWTPPADAKESQQ